MSVNETLGALGSWDIQLREETPDYVLDQLGFFGHVAIADGYVDVTAVGDGLLTGARYVGVLRAKDKDTGRKLSGSGMVFWLGDEDDKGDILEAEISLTSASLSTAVHAILDPSNAVTVGTVYSVAGTYTGKHQFQTRREALSIICDAFNVEFRVNGNGTVDVGTAAQLYNTEAPDTIIVRKGAGTDMNLVALGGDYEVGESVYDYSTRVVLLGQTIGTGDTPDEVFATGSADAPSVPYVNLRGNPVKMSRTISESGTTTGSVAARAQLQLNRFNRVARSLKVTAEEFETEGNFVVGDNVYVYDPDTGIVDPATEVTFRGEVLHPDVVRASGITWPVVLGMTVAFRTQAGVWLDLTPFVTWETGGNEVTVGDLPKSLTKPGDNPVQVRLDAARGDASIPNAPTGLALTTFSTLNAQGQTGAVIHAAWTAPSLNTDGSVITDLSHYVVEYRWTGRAPQWQQANATDLTEIDLIVVPGLPYEVRVTAYDLAGNPSAPTANGTITSAADAIAPNAPADPVVTSYLGQLRIEYAGTDSSGNPMATDTNRIDVHVGTTAGFTATTATRVASITPFAKGVAYATAPYGSTRYVRLIAVDHSGNASASSAVISGATTQVADGDVASMSVGKLTAGTMAADVIISGRFTTALTGQRREVNAVGFQAYNASNALTVNIDGANNLLTGIFQTGLTGTRRITLGAFGNNNMIQFWAPDGRSAQIGSFTGSPSSAEAIRIGMSMPTVSQFWNNIQIDDAGGIFAYSAFNQIAIGGDGPEAVKSFQVVWATTRGTVAAPAIATTQRFTIDQLNTISHLPASGSFVVKDTVSNSNRFGVTADRADVTFPAGGQGMVVWEKYSGTDYPRLWVRANSHSTYFREGGSYEVVERSDDYLFTALRHSIEGNGKQRFITENSVGTAGQPWVQIERPIVPAHSPRLMMFTEGGFGGALTYAYQINSVEVTAYDYSGYIPIAASAFTVSSDRATKRDIANADIDFLAEIRSGGKVREYRRKGADIRRRQKVTSREGDNGEVITETEDITEAAVAPLEIGLVAQEAPDRIRASLGDKGLGIDLYQGWAMHHGALQQIGDTLDDVLTRLSALEKRGKAA